MGSKAKALQLEHRIGGCRDLLAYSDSLGGLGHSGIMGCNFWLPQSPEP